MAKIFVEAYGCSASYSDSEMISGLIVNGGHTLAENSEDSDLNVIVTCSVKDATADKMIRKIMDSSSKPLVVAGCLPKAEKTKVEKFAENASLLGPNSIGKTLQVIQSTLDGKKTIALEDSDTDFTWRTSNASRPNQLSEFFINLNFLSFHVFTTKFTDHVNCSNCTMLTLRLH